MASMSYGTINVSALKAELRKRCKIKRAERKANSETSEINDINPVVDRIMEDDSVEMVIMANHEGLPILTNGNALGAAHYAAAIHRLSTMVRALIKDIDPFDETLVFRVKTIKHELLAAPHQEFNIIVVQHGRPKKVKKSTKKTKRYPAQDC